MDVEVEPVNEGPVVVGIVSEGGPAVRSGNEELAALGLGKVVGLSTSGGGGCRLNPRREMLSTLITKLDTWRERYKDRIGWGQTATPRGWQVRGRKQCRLEKEFNLISSSGEEGLVVGNSGEGKYVTRIYGKELDCNSTTLHLFNLILSLVTC